MPNPIIQRLLDARTKARLKRDAVGLWLFETSGNLGLDSSPKGNHLTNNNSVSQVAGRVGQAASFVAASSQYFSVTSNTSLTPTAAMSWAGWIYLNSLGANQTAVSKWLFQTDGGWWLQIANTSDLSVLIAPTAADAGTVHGNTTSTGLTTGTWYHVAVVFDGSGATNAARLKIYVNGVQFVLTFTGTIPAALLANSAAFVLGQVPGLGRFWNGRLDEAGLWPRVLTSPEIAWLAAGHSLA